MPAPYRDAIRYLHNLRRRIGPRKWKAANVVIERMIAMYQTERRRLIAGRVSAAMRR